MPPMAAYPTAGHDDGSGAYDCSPNDAALGKASPGRFTEWEEEAHSLRDGRGQTKRRWFRLLLKLAACLLVAIVAIKAMRPNPETPTLVWLDGPPLPGPGRRRLEGLPFPGGLDARCGARRGRVGRIRAGGERERARERRGGGDVRAVTLVQ